MNPSIATPWFVLAACSLFLNFIIGIHDVVTTRNNTSFGRVNYSITKEMISWKHQAQRYEEMLRQNGILPVEPWAMPLPGQRTPSSRPIPHAQHVISQLEAARRSVPSRPMHPSRWTEE